MPSSATPSTPDAALTADERRRVYRLMRANRTLEERLTACYRQGKITGGYYRSLGQEATSVGSALALGATDIMAPMLRNLGSLLVRGVRARDIAANYLARASGPTGGKDNVVHFGTVDGEGNFTMDERGGVVSCISPLGNLVSVLGGMVLGARLQGRDTVAMTWAGDGSISTGEFHEGMNFVCALRLPMVVIVENNGWAYSTPVAKQTLLTDLADRALAYGCPGEIVDGQDVEAVLEVSRRAVARARAGQGPTLIEAKTFRMKGHVEHDDQRYVDETDLAVGRARDPLERYTRTLLDQGVTTAAQLESIDAEVAGEIDAEVAEAEAMPLSDDPRIVYEGIYGDAEAAAWVRKSRADRPT